MRRRAGDSTGGTRPAAATAATAPPSAGRTALRGRWLTRGKDGRLTLYRTADGGLLRWTERRPGSLEWAGPDFFPVADLTDLTVEQGADTYVHFVGRRERMGPRGPAVDVVHAIQYQTGRPVTEWRSLGNPYRDVQKGTGIGVPSAVVDTRGTVFVLLRNLGGGLQARREEKGGKWGPWQDLKGSRLADGAISVAVSDGRVEVAVPTERGVQQWRQAVPDGPLKVGQPMRMHALPGSGVALETAPGRVTYYWTEANGSGVVAFRAGSWPVPLGGAPADGALAALRAPVDGYDCTILAQRGAGGTLLIGICGTEAELNGVWWSDTAVACSGDPALALDAYGRVVVAVPGPDGAQLVARQEPGPGLTFGQDWQRL
ncbi:hypothetical protein [Streptomyces beihaiensis]|uniref:Uncharacterized protein n=1 Tax=Streptomyces beihaiensis TaxID=2984495 RepID=A0ABT3TZT9_9ACTN|nr:hypothetical protein [Streptomyces beihaiensis]MCX3062573.1 hypothetical protein [Streptomyces beihaiensis]